MYVANATKMESFWCQGMKKISWLRWSPSSGKIWNHKIHLPIISCRNARSGRWGWPWTFHWWRLGWLWGYQQLRIWLHVNTSMRSYCGLHVHCWLRRMRRFLWTPPGVILIQHFFQCVKQFVFVFFEICQIFLQLNNLFFRLFKRLGFLFLFVLSFKLFLAFIL